MIVTVTPNPSLDRTVEVDRLERGEVLRTRAGRLDPGGKGVNVARALAANDHDVTAVVPLGGFDGDELGALLASVGLVPTVVPVAGATRSNVTIVEPDGTTTKLNAPGAELDSTELAALVEATLAAAGDTDWVVACGSLPPGAPTAFYAELTSRLRDTGHHVAVDTSGPPLRKALGSGPDVVKPNHHELAEAVGRPVATVGDAVEAAAELHAAGVGAVVVSLGANGALLVDADGAAHASCPVTAVRSTVGSGDALLAGFLAGGARGREALAVGVAWGAAATELSGTRMPGPSDVRRERVELSAAVPAHLPLAGA